MEQDPIAKCRQTMSEWNAEGIEIPEYDIELLADMSFFAAYPIINLPDGQSRRVVFPMNTESQKAADILGKASK